MKRPLTIKFEKLPPRSEVPNKDLAKIFGGGCAHKYFVCGQWDVECCPGLQCRKASSGSYQALCRD